jgi:hypothetical protein
MSNEAVEEAVWFLFEGLTVAVCAGAAVVILGLCAIYVLTCLVRKGFEEAKRQLAERTLSRVTQEASDGED